MGSEIELTLDILTSFNTVIISLLSSILIISILYLYDKYINKYKYYFDFRNFEDDAILPINPSAFCFLIKDQVYRAILIPVMDEEEQYRPILLPAMDKDRQEVEPFTPLPAIYITYCILLFLAVMPDVYRSWDHVIYLQDKWFTLCLNNMLYIIILFLGVFLLYVFLDLGRTGVELCGLLFLSYTLPFFIFRLVQYKCDLMAYSNFGAVLFGILAVFYTAKKSKIMKSLLKSHDRKESW